MMLAVALKQPIMVIETAEAKMLAEAVADVAKLYAVEVNPKALAWFNLAAAGVAVYGPKVFMLVQAQKAQQRTAPAPAQQAEASNVQSIQPGRMRFE